VRKPAEVKPSTESTVNEKKLRNEIKALQAKLMAVEEKLTRLEG
jgi:hypothetical protein